MANTLRVLLGMRSRDSSQDPEVPRTTKQIQEMVDWQNLRNHLEECEKGSKKGHESAASASSCEVTQRGWNTVSTQSLEKELLGRKFHAAHNEVGRRASELQDIVLQLGEAVGDDECQKAFQIYAQLMQDSTELFGALANKMAKLRNRIDLVRPLSHNRRPQSRGRASLTTQPTNGFDRAGSTQHRVWVQPKAPEHAPSHRSSFRRPASSSRPSARNFMSPEASELHPNSASSQPVQVGYPEQPVTKQQVGKAKVLSEAQAKTTGDLPTLQPGAQTSGDLPAMQPSTLPDLPVLSEDLQ